MAETVPFNWDTTVVLMMTVPQDRARKFTISDAVLDDVSCLIDRAGSGEGTLDDRIIYHGGDVKGAGLPADDEFDDAGHSFDGIGYAVE